MTTQVTAEIDVDGVVRPLKLTLGALAEIEAGLGGGDLAALVERLKAPSAADILFVLHALLKGGGADVTLAALGACDIDLADAAQAIGAAFSALNGDAVDDASGQGAPGKSQAGEADRGRQGARSRGETGSGRGSS